MTELSPENERYAAARGWLTRLLGMVDFAPPYEIFARILTDRTIDGETGRQRIVARLGIDAEDPVEEFMNLTLAHERAEIPSLQIFCTG